MNKGMGLCADPGDDGGRYHARVALGELDDIVRGFMAPCLS